MKIGPLDVSITLIASVAGLIASIVIVIGMWNSNKDARLESMYRSSIVHALTANLEAEPEATKNGADSCRVLIARNPGKNNARLFLGTILLREKNWQEAVSTFMEVVGNANATDQEKAISLVSAAVAGFNAATKEGQNKTGPAAEKAVLESEKLLQQALALPGQKDNPDALINLALLQLFKNQPDSFAAMQQWYDRASAVNAPASLNAQEQLYALSGRILIAAGKYEDATLAFERAKGIKPSYKDVVNGRRFAILATVSQANMDVKKRTEMLVNTQREAFQYGPNQSVAHNAVGVGWFKTKPQVDYDSYAINAFRAAIAADPKDPRGYRNLAAVLEDQIAEIGQKLSADVTGIRGETPIYNKWIVRQDLKLPKFPVVDVQQINRIRRMVDEDEVTGLDRLWKDYLANVNVSPADKFDAKLRLLSVVRRNAYILDEAHEINRGKLQDRALNIAKELVKEAPDDPRSYYALGQVYVDRKSYLDAVTAFKTSQAKGLVMPELAALVDQLSRKPELVDRRPDEKRRSYGTRPIISGTVKTMISSTDAKITMKIDDKPVNAFYFGTQMLFLPSDNDVGDGEHKVSVTMTSPNEPAPIEFTPVAFTLDRRPPNCTVSPDPREGLTPKSVWTVNLSDPSGVDSASLNVSVSCGGGKGNNRVIIENGKYKVIQQELGIKANTFVDTDKPIKFGYGFEMPNGECKLSITVQDQAGNELKEVKTYFVKGGQDGVVSPKKSTIKFQEDPSGGNEK